MLYDKKKMKKKTGSGSGEGKKSSRGMNILLRVLTVLLLGVFAFSGYKLVTALRSYKESEDSYTDLEQYVSVDVELPPEEDPQPSGDTQPQDEPKKPYVSPYKYLQDIGADFDALSAINDDVVAWITISGTKLNYPVVQGDDNSYYLRHLFQGGYNVGGCVFLDVRNDGDFSDRHSILYGHRMDDGSMFTCIQNYKKQSYYDQHPYGLLLTPDGNYVIEFFSGYVTSTSDNAWSTSLKDNEKYQEWLDSLIEKSDFTANFTPTVKDRVITLSTCSKALDNGRYVLHGVIRQKAG